MNGALRKAALAFSAGTAGSVANTLFVILVGAAGVIAALGITARVQPTPDWIYPRIVWGGLWGFLLLLPVLRNRWIARGLLLGLVPAAYNLLVIFPWRTPHGLFGVGAGDLMFVLVFAANAVWSLTAAWVWNHVTSQGAATD